MDDDMKARVARLMIVTHDENLWEVATANEVAISKSRAECARLINATMVPRPRERIIELIAAHPALPWCADYMASIKL